MKKIKHDSLCETETFKTEECINCRYGIVVENEKNELLLICCHSRSEKYLKEIDEMLSSCEFFEKED